MEIKNNFDEYLAKFNYQIMFIKKSFIKLVFNFVYYKISLKFINKVDHQYFQNLPSFGSYYLKKIMYLIKSDVV